MDSEPVILQDPRLDPDRFILEGIDTSEGPYFTVSQVGKIFFARSSYWVRWIEEEHKNVLDGDPECPHYEKVKRQIDAVGDDGRPYLKTVTSNLSWVVDGVCTHCGGKQVAMSKTATGSRVYSLFDLEMLIHALASSRAITGAQAHNALLLVQTIAKIYNYLP